jgi:chromosome segregation ATPase
LNNEIAALETHIQNNESVNSANTSKSQEVADLENRISQSNARLREIESLKIENKRAVDANHQAVTDNLNEAKAALRMLEVQYSAAVKSYRQTQDQIQMILHAERGDEKAIESLKASLSKEELELNQLTSELANKEAELKSIEN